jgi:hypothetical protein
VLFSIMTWDGIDDIIEDDLLDHEREDRPGYYHEDFMRAIETYNLRQITNLFEFLTVHDVQEGIRRISSRTMFIYVMYKLLPRSHFTIEEKIRIAKWHEHCFNNAVSNKNWRMCVFIEEQFPSIADNERVNYIIYHNNCKRQPYCEQCLRHYNV